jgi:PHD/YefM family antitoxin component YafN of YafNO toxin-antitoxin module
MTDEALDALIAEVEVPHRPPDISRHGWPVVARALRELRAERDEARQNLQVMGALLPNAVATAAERDDFKAERDELRAKLDKLGPLAEREAERELRREAAIDARDARRDTEEGKKAP